MTNIKELIKKYGVGSITFWVSLDSYRRMIKSHNEELAKKEAEYSSVISDLHQQIFSDTNKTLAEKTKICSKMGQYFETDESLINIRSKLQIMNEKLLTKNYEAGEDQKSVSTMQEFYSKRVSDLEIEQAINKKELKVLFEDIVKSDPFDWFWNLIENYRLFLSTLDLDQIVAVLNIIGHLMVLSAVFSITIILAGNYLIKNFNLEVKFPKLAYFIKTREKLTKAYLWLHVILLFTTLFINIGANLYIFFLRYYI